MKKLILLFCVFLGGFSSSLAQQEAIYSQYMFNTLAINPAYAGNRDVLSLTAIGRHQWIGVNGAPTTYSLTADMPFIDDNMGIGISLYNDAIGLANNTGANLAYSYKLRFSETTTLSLGVQAGVTNINWMLSNTNNIGNDPAFAGNSDINKFYPNVGGGFFLNNDVAYLGFSVPNIIEQAYSEDNAGSIKRHYYTMAGIVLGQGNVKFKPSTLIRISDGAGIGADLNLNVWFNDKIAFGVSGRKSQMNKTGTDLVDAIIGMVEYQVSPQFRLGYAYDYTMSDLNESKSFVALPSHEVLLRYEFGFNKKKIITPRYF